MFGVRAAVSPSLVEDVERRKSPHSSGENPLTPAAKIPSLLEDHVEDQREDSEPDGSAVVSTADRARALTKAWWDHSKAETGKAPTAVKFIAVAKIVEQLMERFEDREIKHGLVDAAATSTVSVRTVEMAINQRAQKAGVRPGAAGYDESWLNDPMFNTGREAV
jgi:hypothetical protein